MPDVLLLLAVIALVLYILFGYVLPPWSAPPAPTYWRSGAAVLVIIIVLLMWYVLPVHVGR
jgi:hypothetical protein